MARLTWSNARGRCDREHDSRRNSQQKVKRERESQQKPCNTAAMAASPAKRKRLEDCIGMDLAEDHPKTTVRKFMTRYLGRDPCKDDYWYTSFQQDDGRITAEFHVPSFHDIVHVSEPCNTEKEAHKSAAQHFLDNSDVQSAAKSLPATMSKIKYCNKQDPSLKRQLRSLGQSLSQHCRDQYNEMRTPR